MASRWYGHLEETVTANIENKTAHVGSISSDMASERRQPVQMAQFLQKEIDIQNMNSVVAVLTTLLRVKQIFIGVYKMDSGIAGSKQEKCDEISNERKNMLIKICWTTNFI